MKKPIVSIGLDWGGTTYQAIGVYDQRFIFIDGLTGCYADTKDASFSRLREVLNDIFKRLVAEFSLLADSPLFELKAGLSGYDWSYYKVKYNDFFDSFEELASYFFENDSYLGMKITDDFNSGISLVAGTGPNCRGWDDYGNCYRLIGTGGVFHEFGSADCIVGLALKAVGLEWTKKIPHTRITDALCDLYDTDIDTLIMKICEKEIVVNISFSEVVYRLAQDGDVKAKDILEEVSYEQFNLVETIINQIKNSSHKKKIFGIGSLMQTTNFFPSRLRERLQIKHPDYELLVTNKYPVLGAVRLTSGWKELKANVQNQIKQTCVRVAKEF